MAITTEQAWRSAGAPWEPARPIGDLAYLMHHGYGYTVGIIGDEAHLSAAVPEDHTPYSHTPWPGPQPYPKVLAEDIESAPAGLPSTAQIGGQLYRDKLAGVHGTEWIKYLNWTDPQGNTWHDQWMPDHHRSSSPDRGHTHISARTDYAASSIVVASGYDPVARYLEEHGMAGVDLNLAQDLGNGLSLRNALVSTYVRSLPDLASRMDAVLAAAHNDAETAVSIADDARAQLVADLVAALPPAAGGTAPTAEEIATAVCDKMAVRLGP